MRNYIVIAIFCLFLTELDAIRWPISNSTTQDIFTSAFGPRILSNAYDFHRGMDISATTDDAVHAAAAGTVYEKYINSSGMKVVGILHNDGIHRSRYLHLSSFAEGLIQGSNVAEGQIIGMAGNSGCSEVHLHFDIKKNGIGLINYIHPLEIMPYNNNIAITINMVSVDCTNPSFEVKVSRDELDVRKLVICTDSVPFGYGSDWIFEGEYAVDYDNTNYNVPVNNNVNNIILNDLSINDDYEAELWRLYIEPDDLDYNSTQQRIVYRLESCAEYDDGLEEEMQRLEVFIYTAGNSTNFETSFLNYHFEDPATIINNLEIPETESYLSNYPNPFNPTTQISYALAENPINPVIEIFNVKGQRVKTFRLEEKEGTNSVTWQGKDETGTDVASGVYMYRLINNGRCVETKKMMLLK